MQKLHRAAAVAAATFLTIWSASTASAQDGGGRWQAKLFMSGVLPDGEIIEATGPAAAALTGADVKASDNWVPTLAIEYFPTKNLSIETICCGTMHHMTGTGALAGVPLVDHVVVVPATVTAKLHFDLGAVKPYVGAGPALILFPNNKPSSALRGMGLTDVDIAGKFSFAFQAGFDIPLNNHGLSFTADAKRYISHPVARFYDAAGVEQLRTRHRLDPWVIGAGLAYRF